MGLFFPGPVMKKKKNGSKITVNVDVFGRAMFFPVLLLLPRRVRRKKNFWRSGFLEFEEHKLNEHVVSSYFLFFFRYYSVEVVLFSVLGL